MTDSDHQMKEIVLREIEPVLQQRLGDPVIVEDFTSKSLLPPGENYGSTILSVQVNLKNRNTQKKEELHLIAKMCPPTEFQRRIFNSARTFAKEIFMYETIMPAYNKLQLECGLRKNELFDVLPEFYGSRLSLRPDGEFDDDAVILMENLKVKGYYTGDRTIGYDLDHSELAVKALARFHALGIAVKQKRPGMFEVFKMYARSLQIDGDTEGAQNMFSIVLDAMKNDPEMSPYYDRCYKVLADVSLADLWSDVQREPWTTIIHSDFWVNNVMFHRNAKNKIDSVKLVDFQMYLYGSPIRDLIFFLYSSVDREVTEDQIEDLMDLYYETMLNTLTKMGCSTSVFTKEGFKAKMAEDAVPEFIHCCFMVKVLTLDPKEISDFNYDKMEAIMTNYGGSKLFVERLRKLVLCFVQRNWI